MDFDENLTTVPCSSGDTNDNVKRNLTWKDPELDEIFPQIFGIRMHFTFFTKPTPIIHPRRVTEFHALPSFQLKVHINVNASIYV